MASGVGVWVRHRYTASGVAGSGVAGNWHAPATTTGNVALGAAPTAWLAPGVEVTPTNRCLRNRPGATTVRTANTPAARAAAPMPPTNNISRPRRVPTSP